MIRWYLSRNLKEIKVQAIKVSGEKSSRLRKQSKLFDAKACLECSSWSFQRRLCSYSKVRTTVRDAVREGARSAICTGLLSFCNDRLFL
jgi:hypothetical protein